MSQYRCYFVDAEEAVTQLEDLDAENDREAKKKAQSLYRERSDGPLGYELWRANKLVTREPPSK